MKEDAEKDPTETQSARLNEWFVRNERFYWRINEENGLFSPRLHEEKKMRKEKLCIHVPTWGLVIYSKM